MDVDRPTIPLPSNDDGRAAHVDESSTAATAGGAMSDFYPNTSVNAQHWRRLLFFEPFVSYVSLLPFLVGTLVSRREARVCQAS